MFRLKKYIKAAIIKKKTKVVDLNSFIQYREALKIVYRNILIKSFGTTRYNKEFMHLKTYGIYNRITNNCQNIFDDESIFFKFIIK